jgi:hypothetical protein
MKKLSLILLTALAIGTAFTSCKKDYECVCTWEVSGQKQTQSVPMNGVTKKDAKSACKALDKNYTAFTGVDCALK